MRANTETSCSSARAGAATTMSILLVTLASLALGLEPITDPVEKERRQKTLEEAEKDEKEQNNKFLNGQSDFFVRINE